MRCSSRSTSSRRRRSRGPSRLAWTVVGALALALARGHEAWAQSSTAAERSPLEAARVHFERGLVLLDQQNADGARVEFQRAYDLSQRPNVLFNLGVALQMLHRYPEATRVFERYLREVPDAPPERRAQVRDALALMASLLGYVDVRVTTRGAQVSVDGIDLGTAPLDGRVPIGPGRHVFEARLERHETARAVVVIASGDTLPVELAPRALDRDPPPARARGVVLANPDPSRTPSRAGLGPAAFGVAATATGALLIASGVVGLVALSTHAELLNHAQGDPEVPELVARGEAERTTTNALLVAAAAGAVITGALAPFTRFAPPRRADSGVTVGARLVPGGASAAAQVAF